MTNKNIQFAGRDLVKKLTEAPFKKMDARNGQTTPYADDLKLIHQLQVLRLEMEMEHEQRYQEPVSSEEITRKQTELFEFAPNGYFALNTEGRIQEVNHTAARILGVEKDQLIHQLFINYVAPEDREWFLNKWFSLVKTNEYQEFQAPVVRNDGYHSYVKITLSGTWINEDFQVLLTMTDITLWKQLEEAQNFLMDSSRSLSGQDFFHSLTEYLGKSLQMDYVGVDRLTPKKTEAERISVYDSNEINCDIKYDLQNASIGKLLEQKRFCFPNGAHYLFPNDKLIQQLKAESFAGITLMGHDDAPVGIIIVMGRRPLLDSRPAEMVLNQVSLRAAAELEHLQMEELIVDSKEKYKRELKEKTAALQAINKRLRGEIKNRQQEIASLKTAEEKYRTIADLTYHWETWLSPTGEFIYVSSSCKRISGYSAGEFMQDPALFIRIIHPEDRPYAEEQFSKALKGELTACSFEYRIITRDGYERWIGHHFQPVSDSLGNYMGQRGSSQDVTKRKVAEKILLDSQKHLRQLSQRMEEITEAERTRIAREIHDELGHLLTALKYDMEGFINQPDITSEDLKYELGMMMDMVDSLIDSVRKIATELRPGILDHLGLIPAIEWQIKQFRLRTKICCVLSMEETNVNFDKNETNIIFRILQEILTNIIRHAKATHVKVLLTNTNSCFQMEVTDNGIGFNYDDIPPDNTLGFIGMKERALSIGGEIQINSKPQKGTMVRLLLPRN